MARRGQFKKGGGRVGHHRSKTRYKTKYKTRYKTKYKTRYKTGHRGHRRRRRHHGGGGMSLKHLAIAGAGLAFLTGASSPIKAIPDNVAKLPGAKTFGNPAVAGLALLGVDHFLYKNKWLRAAGVVGVVLGAVQVGTKGKDFQWVGDAPRLRGPARDQLRGGQDFAGDVEGPETGTLSVDDEEYDDEEDELDDEIDDDEDDEDEDE